MGALRDRAAGGCADAGRHRQLAGALCAHLVLFGPLVLIPQVLIGHSGSVVHAGLLLSALPTGSGWPPQPARESYSPAGRTGAAAWTAVCWLPAAPPRWRSPPRIW